MRSESFHLRLPEELSKVIEATAVTEGISKAELIRRYIEKGIDVDGYHKETEFIRGIIRKELESILEPAINRIIKMLMKTGKISAGGFFVMLRNLFGSVTEENKVMFNDFIQRYMGMGVDYMSMKDININSFLTSDGAALSRIANGSSIKAKSENN